MTAKAGRSKKARGWSRLACEDAEFEDEDDDDFLSDDPPTRDESTPFRFKELTAEVKNMIYRHLVIPDYGKLLSVTRPSSRRSQISTAILYVDRELYQEASAILYGYNILQINTNPYPNEIIRMDEHVGGTRRLRNGRLSGSTTFTGIIYPHVLRRFRKIQLDLQINVYGSSLPGPVLSEFRGLASLKELLEVVSSQEPAPEGSACKSLRLKATEIAYPHQWGSLLSNLTHQLVPLEQCNFSDLFDRIQETRDLVLVRDLCAQSTSGLINGMLGRILWSSSSL